jgi:hypothetical protein
MNKFFLSVFCALFLLSPFAEAEHFKVNLEDFETLEIRTSGSIDWKSGPAEASLDCSSAIFDEIELEQIGKKLIIRWKNTGRPSWKFGTDKLLIHLHSEYLKKIDISGSADVRFLSVNKIPDFSLNILGSGDFSGQLDCSGTVSMIVSGSGDLSPSGNCKNLQVSISGSGDFKGYGLKSEKAEVKVSGSGDVQLFASEELDASMSGSGDILYAGKPKRVSKKLSGSGEISPVK